MRLKRTWPFSCFLRRGLIYLLSGVLCFCSRAPRLQLDPESQRFYEYARLIMTGEEDKIFSQLTDAASRQEFIEEFWAKRDPDPETEENEFKNEFYRRIDYANKHFREGVPGWKTDRGRIYIYMGPPDKFEEFFTHDDPNIRGSILWWIYYDYELVVEFADRNGMSHFEIRNYSGDFFGAMEKMKLGQIGLTEKGLKVQKVDFDLAPSEAGQGVTVSLPFKAFHLPSAGGELTANLIFEFFIYDKEGRKVQRFQQERKLSLKEEDAAKMKTVEFSFSLGVDPGDYYVDCLIYGQGGTFPKVRKIFEMSFEK